MARMRVQLFGGPEVTTEDGAVELTPHQACLLTLVAGGGKRGVSRVEVIRTIWEEGDTPRTRHRLRQLLHGLRARAGGLAAGGPEADPLRLAPGASDLARWDRLRAEGRLAEAAEMVERGFAPRLVEVPSRTFQDWLDAKRQALRSDLLQEAARTWDGCRRGSRWHEGRDAAEALYRLRPTDEVQLRCVIEARAMTGDVQAAEAAFAAFTAWLEEGREPETSTVELMERVRQLPEESRRLMARTRSGPAVPLVGRTRILRELEASLDHVRQGEVQLSVLTGEGGIGKSRVLEELRRRASLEGFRVLSARPVEVERRLPLSALADALSGGEIRSFVEGLAEPWRTLVAAFLPTHEGISTLPQVPPVQESALSRRLLDAFSFLLEAVCAERPTLLTVDDMQWADDTTLAVLQSVKRRWGEGMLGIVGTVRPPRETGRRWPSPYLNQLVALASHRQELESLSQEESREVVRLTAGRKLDPDAEDRLVALGGRNPFFLIELTRDHLNGRLPLAQAPGEALPLPISLQELFEHRLDTLSGDARATAEILAIRARPTPMTDLASLSERSLEDSARAVEELLRQRLAEVDRGRAAISHELFRSAFYRQVSPARLAVRHLRIAEHLMDREGPAPHGELALHFARGGEARKAAHHGRLAADRAVENGAIAEATHLLRIVVDNEPDPTSRALAAAELARLHHVSRDMERAAPLLASAAAQLRVVGRRTEALRLDIRRVESLVEAVGTPVAEAVDRLARIKEEAHREGDWVAVAMALDTEMHLHHQVGDVESIQGIFDEVRACTRSGDREAQCLANASLAMSILFGDPAEGLAAARRAVEIAEEDELGRHLLRAQTRLIVVLLYQGKLNLPGATELVTSARTQAAAIGDLGERIMLEANLGAFLADEGRFELAAETFAGVVRQFRNAEARIPKFNFLVNRAYLARKCMDPEEAQRLLDQAAEQVVPDFPDYMLDCLNAEYGLVALQMGNLSGARRHGERLLGAEEGPIYFDPTSILQFRIAMSRRSGTQQEALDHVRAVADQLEGQLVQPWLKVGVVECRLAARLRRRDDVRYQKYLQKSETLQLRGTMSALRAIH